MIGFLARSLEVLFVCSTIPYHTVHYIVPPFWSIYALVLLVRLMLVGIWLGLHWVLFYFFDHYIQSSVQSLIGYHLSSIIYSKFSPFICFLRMLCCHLPLQSMGAAHCSPTYK